MLYEYIYGYDDIEGWGYFDGKKLEFDVFIEFCFEVGKVVCCWYFKD